MASALRIIDLDGKTINIVKGKDQSWREVIERANLPKRFGFCVKHWLSDDPEDNTTEEIIKAYLDRIGYIMIQDKPDSGILTDYKEQRDRIAIVPVSEYAPLENMFYGLNDHEEKNYIPMAPPAITTQRDQKIFDSLTKPKKIPPEIKRLQEKRKRIDAMRKAHPDVFTTFLPVDTENCFKYEGKTYQIDDLEQYRPRRIRGEDVYDMDQVVCAKCADGIFWYDQEFNSIDGHVHEA